MNREAMLDTAGSQTIWLPTRAAALHLIALICPAAEVREAAGPVGIQDTASRLISESAAEDPRGQRGVMGRRVFVIPI